MGTTQPIRDPRQLSQFINYYATTQPNQRNYTLIVIGLHTALRISDILTLQWKNVFDFKTTKCRTHLQIIEHKTGKKSKIALCPESQKALSDFYIMKKPNPEDYVFSAKKSAKQTTQPFAGISHCTDSRRKIHSRRTYQLPFTAQDFWLSCLETRSTTGTIDGHIQSFFL